MAAARLLVLDASVWLKAFLDEADSDVVEALIESDVVFTAPDLLFAEFTNVMWLKQRAGALTADEARTALDDLVAFFDIFNIAWTAELMTDALALAMAIDHPIYDCFYLALAERSGAAMITADRRFVTLVRSKRPTAPVQLLAEVPV